VQILDAVDAPQDAEPMHFETISLSEESLFPSVTILGVQQTKDYSGGSLRLPDFSTDTLQPLVTDASKRR